MVVNAFPKPYIDLAVEHHMSVDVLTSLCILFRYNVHITVVCHQTRLVQYQMESK